MVVSISAVEEVEPDGFHFLLVAGAGMELTPPGSVAKVAMEDDGCKDDRRACGVSLKAVSL